MKLINLLVIFIVILVASCSDTVTNEYTTHEEAVDNHLFGRGWLPNILPSSASNIKTSNNLDNNTSTGYFNIPLADIPIFIKQLTKGADSKYRYSNQHGRNWLFEVNMDNGHVQYELLFNQNS